METKQRDREVIKRRRQNEQTARRSIQKRAARSRWSEGRKFFEIQRMTALLNDMDGVAHG